MYPYTVLYQFTAHTPISELSSDYTLVLFVYFFIKAYVVGTHLNCMDLIVDTIQIICICIYKENQKNKKHKNMA